MRVLILSQEYPVVGADFVFVHAADVATELQRRGHEVTVLTTSRGKARREAPRTAAPAAVTVHRLPFTWFGKSSYIMRVLAALSFFVQAGARMLLGRRPDVLLVSTAPPMIGPVSTVLAAARRVPIVFWAMDLNPDQLAALDRLRPDGLAYRVLDGWMRWFVRRCRSIIALDESMRSRLVSKGADPRIIVVVPPWADDRHIVGPDDAAGPAAGCERDGTGERVLLYSGNLSPSNPITALLAAFERSAAGHRLSLAFMGTGGLLPEVAAASRRLPGRVSLCQPLPSARLGAALSAAAVHVATMGPRLCGILHPSKVYAALAAGRPVLFIGPAESPSARLVRDAGLGWAVIHDADRIVECLLEIDALPDAALAALGRHCRHVSQQRFAQHTLTVEVVECVLAAAAGRRVTA